MNGIDAALFTFDGDRRLLFVSERTAALLGSEPGRAYDTVAMLLDACRCLDAASIAAIHQAITMAVADEASPPPLVLSPANAGRTFSFQISKLDTAWMALCADVTEQRIAESEARRLSMRDPLTGLANRQVLAERISLPGNPTPTWMFLVDLDRFKAVNDTLGHPIGDLLLKLVGQRLLSALRPDDIVARLGGDEFALLVHHAMDEVAAAKLAKRLVDVLGRPYLINGHVIHIGASIGIARACSTQDHDHLFRNADLALYAAKRAGRNTFCFFDPAMDVRAHLRRSMEIDLRKAIALRQLELHYQPQIDLDRNTIVGFEALVRWRCPARGLVPPGEFIPLAEEIGLIVQIGEWVLREACQEAMHWPETISVAVNVSPCQFESPTALMTAVERALKLSGLPGKRLEVEITESVLLRDEGSVLGALHAMRGLGVRVAMDDFGTGYSSLSQLNSFPFDKIKIDRSFVSGAGGDQNAIVRAITALGVSLGMATIAEGVETAEELAQIRANGCTSVQGYLFSRPVPTEKIGALIAGFVTDHAHCNAA